MLIPAARRSLSFRDATRERTYAFQSSLFPLHLAVMYRSVFLTELWRVSVLPYTHEKELWQNCNASANNEAIELQMQQLPLQALTPSVQETLMRTHAVAEDGAALFVQTWVKCMHDWCQDKHVAIHERNTHELRQRAVTTEHATVRRAATGEELDDDTQLVFPGFIMPFSDSRVRFPLLFYLEPTVRGASSSVTSTVSEIALRSRLVVTRARDNACFNVCCDALYLCEEQARDCVQQDTLAAVQKILATETQTTTTTETTTTTTTFKLRQVTDMYVSSFCWFAATQVLLMRLQIMVTKFESGEFRFVPSTEVVTEGASAPTTFEWVLRAGELSAAWETDFLAARQTAFEQTGGLPLAFEKREVAEGYVELEFARFVAEQVLQTQYGRTLSRVSCFERFDQDQMIVRVQPMTREAMNNAGDIGRLFAQGAKQCADGVLTFFRQYKNVF